MGSTRKILIPVLVLFVTLLCTAQLRHLYGQVDDTTELSHRELAIRYAKTKLDLAEVDVQRAMAMNERNIITKLTLERIRSGHAVAQEQYSQAVRKSTDGPLKVRLRHAEERVRLAKLRLDSGLMLKASGSINDLGLQRLRLNHDLAKLNLMLLQEPESVATQLEYMQRQIDRFGEEMLSLDERISKLEARPLR